MSSWPTYISFHLLTYFILSKNPLQAVTRKIGHLVPIRIGMNKMAEGDEYLDYFDETLLEQSVKPWSASLGVFLEAKWRVLNSLKHPHWTGRGKTSNPQLHPSCVI